MTTILALVMLWQFRIVVIYVLISLALAALLRPLVNRLVGKSIFKRVGWILLYLVAVVSLGYFLFLTSENAFNEIQRLAQTLSVQDAWRLPVWLEGSLFQQSVVARLPRPSQLFEAITGSQGQLVLPAILDITKGIGSFVTAGIIILFLSIYWSISQIHFERLWLSLLPPNQRKQARGIWRIIEPDIGAYIRGQLIQGFLAGLLFGVGYWLLGSPYPVFLALAGALVCLIPVVGAPLAVIPPLLIGLLTSTQLSLFMVLYTIAVVIGLGVWVKPRLFNRRWDNPILTIVLLIAMAEAFGLVGIILAPPLSVIINILWTRLVSHRLPTGVRAQVSDLKERQERIWNVVKEMEGPALPLVTTSMERLTQLIVKAEPILESALPAKTTEVDEAPGVNQVEKFADLEKDIPQSETK
jgi:predicted PurR-regulated permease PerM